MSTQETTPLWQARRIRCEFDELRFPSDGEAELSQDREWCEVVFRGRRRRIRFHDYHEVYAIRGLYERLFYEKLRCNSPQRVVRLLTSVLHDFKAAPDILRVLDVGAGNGMVGEELRAAGVPRLVGIDIIPEAREAARRDRPEVYDDYLIADLTALGEADEKRLRGAALNALACVAALGFGDIPAKAFLKALDLIETPGWLAFNIKEDFAHERDKSGFSATIRDLSRREVIQIQAYRRYCHRRAVNGRPLYYLAMVARKLKDLPDDLLAD